MMFKCSLSKYFTLIVFYHIVAVVKLQKHHKCYTPDEYIGSCIELSQCEPLVKLRNKYPTSHQDRLFVSLSTCGYINHEPLVCCSHNSPYPKEAIKEPGNLDIRPILKIADNKLPDVSDCSTALEDRIFGGSDAKIDEFPFSALLYYSKLNGTDADYEYNCGGSLITNRHIITAAHCVSPKILTPRKWQLRGVRLGEYDLRSNPDCGEGVREDYICAPTVIDSAIEQQYIHEDFNENQHNDIAVLKLKQFIRFNKFVRPICLQHSFDVDTDNINFIVSGFGKTESGESSSVKLKTNVGGIKNAECQRLLASQSIKAIADSQICALGIDGKDSCQGDSGNGLIYMNTKSSHAHWVLVGVVSYGPSPCGSNDIPGIYTRIDSFLPWIISKL